MIPATLNVNSEVSTEEYKAPPYKTYRLDFKNKRIIGKIDGKEAAFQYIRKALSTDKYAYPIYNWYYGNEIHKLAGMPYDYVVTELPRIVNESLTVDRRILEATDFEFNQISIDAMTASFVVRTIYGDINYSLEVLI